MFFDVAPLRTPKSLRGCMCRTISGPMLRVSRRATFPVVATLRTFTGPRRRIHVVTVRASVRGYQRGLGGFRGRMGRVDRGVNFACPRNIRMMSTPTSTNMHDGVRTFRELVRLIRSGSRVCTYVACNMGPLSRVVVVTVRCTCHLLSGTSVSYLMCKHVSHGSERMGNTCIGSVATLVRLSRVAHLLTTGGIGGPHTIVRRVVSRD